MTGNLNRLAKSLYIISIVATVFTFLCGCTSSELPTPPSSPIPQSIPETDIESQIIDDLDVEPSVVSTGEPSITQSEEETGNVRYIKGDGVRMRESPSTEARIIAHLSYSEEVRLLENDGRWSKVYYENTEGYIRNDLLSDTVPKQRATVEASVPTEPKEGGRQSNVTAAGQAENETNTISSPKIIVKKSQRKLELWDGDILYDTYPIGLGWNPEGDKKVEGDGRTPEGIYYVCVRNPNSRYYLSLGVSYPNKDDAKEALDAGVIDQNTYRQIANAIDNKSCPPWNTAMGGAIMIHGMGSSSDWTAGCVAVDNDVMNILWKYCPIGTPIIIQP